MVDSVETMKASRNISGVNLFGSITFMVLAVEGEESFDPPGPHMDG